MLTSSPLFRREFDFRDYDTITWQLHETSANRDEWVFGFQVTSNGSPACNGGDDTEMKVRGDTFSWTQDESGTLTTCWLNGGYCSEVGDPHVLEFSGYGWTTWKTYGWVSGNELSSEFADGVNAWTVEPGDWNDEHNFCPEPQIPPGLG